jgi:sorbitol-specific phosphotransferase system component IIBC
MKDLILKDFEISSDIFTVEVGESGQIINIANPDDTLSIISVVLSLNGVDKRVAADELFDISEIEVNSSTFSSVVNKKVSVYIYKLGNYEIHDVFSRRIGHTIDLVGYSNIGLPDRSIIEDVGVKVVLTDAFFNIVIDTFWEFAPAAARRMAKKLFRRSQEDTYKQPEITVEIAKSIGEKIGVNWEASEFDSDQFMKGMIVELEHGLIDSQTNITNDDLVMTGKIALAHLKEKANYYDLLEQVEKSP